MLHFTNSSCFTVFSEQIYICISIVIHVCNFNVSVSNLQQLNQYTRYITYEGSGRPIITPGNIATRDKTRHADFH